MSSLYAIAPGHNNAGGLTLIQNLITFEGERFSPPSIYGTFDPGQFRIRGDGTVSIMGYASTEWLFSFITWGQIHYLNSVYCAGAYSGRVTLKTRTDDPLIYGVYNATMRLDKLPDSRKNFGFQEDYTIHFTRMVAI